MKVYICELLAFFVYMSHFLETFIEPRQTIVPVCILTMRSIKYVIPLLYIF